jgi:hypothetical protein
LRNSYVRGTALAIVRGHDELRRHALLRGVDASIFAGQMGFSPGAGCTAKEIDR